MRNIVRTNLLEGRPGITSRQLLTGGTLDIGRIVGLRRISRASYLFHESAALLSLRRDTLVIVVFDVGSTMVFRPQVDELDDRPVHANPDVPERRTLLYAPDSWHGGRSPRRTRVRCGLRCQVVTGLLPD